MSNANTMKHVVAINGSPKKSCTFQLLSEIAALLKSHNITVTILNMGDFNIIECTGCELCVRKTSACFQNDDAHVILPQLMDADGVILASPVYLMNITGRLKSLIDKTSSWVHRSPMVGKPVLTVATTAGAGLKDVWNYLEKVAVQWGMQPTDRIGRSTMSKQQLSPVAIEKFVWHLFNPPSQYKPSLNQLLQFQVQKALALNVLPIDREFWTGKGWDKELYYYPARVSMLKRGLAWAFFKSMNQRVLKAVSTSHLATEKPPKKAPGIF